VTQPIDARQRILTAALELFAERGFAATTTAAIAHRANVAEKTLFAQFKSKGQLFEDTLGPAVLELAAPDLVTSGLSAFDESSERLDQRLDHLLRSVLANRVEFATTHRSKLKLIIQEVLLRPELFSKLGAQWEHDMLPRFVTLVDRLESLGEVRPLPPASVLRIVISVMVGYLVTRSILLPEADWDDDCEIDLMVSVLVDGLHPPAKSETRVRAAAAASRTPKAAPKARETAPPPRGKPASKTARTRR